MSNENDNQTADQVSQLLARLSHNETIPIVAAIDVETIPDELAVSAMEAPDPPANYKDPVKIREWQTEKLASRQARAALDPYTGKLAIFAVAISEQPDHIVVHTSRMIDPQSDAPTVVSALETLTCLYQYNVKLVTFNGSRFDLPFIRTRAALMGLALTMPPYILHKYRVAEPQSNHVDLLAMLEDDNPNSRSMRLASVLAAYGISNEPPDDELKRNIASMFESEEQCKRCVAMCETDAMDTLKLYLRVARHYL
jgi:DNA polymerase elongation subunit (family B)